MNPKVEVAPEIPAELEGKLETLTELDPRSGAPILPPEPKPDLSNFYERLNAVCAEKKIAQDPDGRPSYIHGKFTKRQTERIMSENPPDCRPMGEAGDQSLEWQMDYCLRNPERWAVRFYTRTTPLFR